jgi:hypothetical protein
MTGHALRQRNPHGAINVSSHGALKAIAYLARTVPKAERSESCRRGRDPDPRGAHGDAASDPPQQIASVQSRSERPALGQAEVEEGPMIGQYSGAIQSGMKFA